MQVSSPGSTVANVVRAVVNPRNLLVAAAFVTDASARYSPHISTGVGFRTSKPGPPDTHASVHYCFQPGDLNVDPVSYCSSAVVPIASMRFPIRKDEPLFEAAFKGLAQYNPDGTLVDGEHFLNICTQVGEKAPEFPMYRQTHETRCWNRVESPGYAGGVVPDFDASRINDEKATQVLRDLVAGFNPGQSVEVEQCERAPERDQGAVSRFELSSKTRFGQYIWRDSSKITHYTQGPNSRFPSVAELEAIVRRSPGDAQWTYVYCVKQAGTDREDCMSGRVEGGPAISHDDLVSRHIYLDAILFDKQEAREHMNAQEEAAKNEL